MNDQKQACVFCTFDKTISFMDLRVGETIGNGFYLNKIADNLVYLIQVNGHLNVNSNGKKISYCPICGKKLVK